MQQMSKNEGRRAIIIENEDEPERRTWRTNMDRRARSRTVYNSRSSISGVGGGFGAPTAGSGDIPRPSIASVAAFAEIARPSVASVAALADIARPSVASVTGIIHTPPWVNQQLHQQLNQGNHFANPHGNPTVNLYYLNDRQNDYGEDCGGEYDVAHTGCSGAIVTNHGIISIKMRNQIRVDITIDRGVRVINSKTNIVLALSPSGSATALTHPNGRVYQYGSRVEILGYDLHDHNNKYAKMWYKGVSFTSDKCALVYLVDSAGTRTTTDNFSDLNHDFHHQVFYNESHFGSGCIEEAIAFLNAASHWTGEDGTINWIINNVRIVQTIDGHVRVLRNSNKFTLRTSPNNGSASLSTPFIHCTASLGKTGHLFVRRGERRMHYDGRHFIVRNAGHSAGFDDHHQLKVF